MKVLIIRGKQGAGKTALADKIIEMNKTKNIFSRIVFENYADPIKILMRFTLNKMADFMGLPYPPEKEKDGDFCQVVGSWAKKKYGRNVWVDILKKTLSRNQEIFGALPLIIIGDCRQENEFDAFPDALRVSLDCPEDERKERAEYWRTDTQHESEIGLDAYAAAGKFDLYYSTSKNGGTPTEQIAEEVFTALFTDFKSGRKESDNG